MNILSAYAVSHDVDGVDNGIDDIDNGSDDIDNDSDAIQGRPQNFFQGGSKSNVDLQGGSKPKNFATWVGQNP